VDTSGTDAKTFTASHVARCRKKLPALKLIDKPLDVLTNKDTDPTAPMHADNRHFNQLHGSDDIVNAALLTLRPDTRHY
jgi:hypothetical protein